MIVVTLPNGNIVRRSSNRPVCRPPLPPRITYGEAIDAVQKLQPPAVPMPREEEPQIVVGRVFARDIVKCVRQAYGLDLADMISLRKHKNVVRARQVAYWLCKRHTALSMPQIGRHLGGRDHTTVLHGCRVIDALIASDTEEAQAVRLIIDQCRRELGLPHDPH